MTNPLSEDFFLATIYQCIYAKVTRNVDYCSVLLNKAGVVCSLVVFISYFLLKGIKQINLSYSHYYFISIDLTKKKCFSAYNFLIFCVSYQRNIRMLLYACRFMATSSNAHRDIFTKTDKNNTKKSFFFLKLKLFSVISKENCIQQYGEEHKTFEKKIKSVAQQ